MAIRFRNSFSSCSQAVTSESNVLSKKDETRTLITTEEFWTDDLNIALETLGNVFGDHHRVPLDKGEFSLGYHFVSSPDLTVAWVAKKGRQAIRAAIPSQYTFIHLPLNTASEYRIGRRTFLARSDNAMLIPSNHEYSLKDETGIRLAVILKTEILKEVMRHFWPGRRNYLSLKVTELRFSRSFRTELMALLRRWNNLTGVKMDRIDPAAANLVETELYLRLAEEVVRLNGCQPLSPRRRQRVDQIARWIDANLNERIDMARLSKIASVGERGLTKDIVAARGLSPMELVTARRLSAARLMLSRGGQNSIAHVAQDCGFSHLGRFAGVYRDAFGEMPSDTLSKSGQVEKNQVSKRPLTTG